MKLDSRISKLEALKPDPRWTHHGSHLQELLRAERTEGTPENIEFNNLYNERRYETDQ